MTPPRRNDAQNAGRDPNDTQPVVLRTQPVVVPVRAISVQTINDAANASLLSFQRVVEDNKAAWAAQRDEIHGRSYISAKALERDLAAAKVTVANELLGDLYMHVLRSSIDPNNAALLYAQDFGHMHSGRYVSFFAVGPRMVEARVRAELRKRSAGPTIDESAVRRGIAQHGKSIEETLRLQYEGPMQNYVSRFLDDKERDGNLIIGGKNVVEVPVMTMPVFAPGGTPANPDGTGVVGTLITTSWLLDDPALRKHLRRSYDELFRAAGGAYRTALKDQYR